MTHDFRPAIRRALATVCAADILSRFAPRGPTGKTKGAVRGPTKYRGIGRAAIRLGFTREHAWGVLEGRSRNPQLARDLKRELKRAA